MLPHFSIETYKRLNPQQGAIYMDVFALLHTHPIYTFNREWKSFVEVRREGKLYNPLFETNEYEFTLIEKIHYGRFAVVKTARKTGYAAERFDVYQISDNGKLLRMGGFRSFYSEGDAVDCIVIMHRIETGEF